MFDTTWDMGRKIQGILNLNNFKSILNLNIILKIKL